MPGTADDVLKGDATQFAAREDAVLQELPGCPCGLE
jgi:hypothetical protein